MIYALLLGLCGRIAAGYNPKGLFPSNVRTVIKLTHGLLWIPFFTWHPSLLALSIIFFLGEKPGVGHPYGWIDRGTEQGEKEWYEFSNNPWIGVFTRGAIYPLLVVLIAYWTPELLYLIPLYAITNVFSFIIGKRLPPFKSFGVYGAWQWSDFLRHFLAVLIFI